MKPINSKPSIGRKKTSVAKCNLYFDEGKNQKLFINSKEDLKTLELVKKMAPNLFKEVDSMFFKIWVKGGGSSSQQAASIKSLIKALITVYPQFKSEIKQRLYLWSDDRIVERKKPGRRKARRSQQWVKR